MDDSRKIKTVVFGMMDGSNKRGRPHREWSDDIEQWCGVTLQELSHAALDRQRWAAIVTMASYTNGCWAHGCRWWWWWCRLWLLQENHYKATERHLHAIWFSHQGDMEGWIDHKLIITVLCYDRHGDSGQLALDCAGVHQHSHQHEHRCHCETHVLSSTTKQ